jgi:hypothetical protein
MLSTIAHLGEPLEPHARWGEVPLQDPAALGFELRKDACHLRNVLGVEPPDERSGMIGARIGEEHTDGGKVPRFGRNDDDRNREFARQRAGMQRTAAAVTEQHEIPRIAAVLDGNAADRTRHDHGRDRNDPVGGTNEAVGTIEAERAGDFLAHRRGCRIVVETEFAAQEIRRVQTPED